MQNRVLSWLRARSRDRRTALKLYGATVTQARSTAFFAGGGVADTVEGRAELLILHIIAVADRLSQEGQRGERPARMLIEAFITDIDDNLREMGVGDLAVPRKVKRAAAGTYERARAYRSALDAEDEIALAHELSQYVPGLDGSPERARALARYTRRLSRHLSTVPGEDLLDGLVTFPAPSEEAGGHA